MAARYGSRPTPAPWSVRMASGKATGSCDWTSLLPTIERTAPPSCYPKFARPTTTSPSCPSSPESVPCEGPWDNQCASHRTSRPKRLRLGSDESAVVDLMDSDHHDQSYSPGVCHGRPHYL